MGMSSISDRFVGTCIACGDYTLRGSLCPGCNVVEGDLDCENPFTWRKHERVVAPSASSQLMAREARASVVDRVAHAH